MIRCVCLSALLTAFAVGGAADPAPKAAVTEVTWSDTFKDGELKDYFKLGDVTWNKRLGGFVVGPNSILVREAIVPVGFDVEAEADVAFADFGKDAGPGRGVILNLRAGYATNDASVHLSLVDGKAILEVLGDRGRPYPLAGVGVDPEGPWQLRMRLRYGMVHAKVWPKGKPEPKDWQITRYTGDSTWEPRMIAIMTNQKNSACVTRLAFRGTRPATDLFLEGKVDILEPRLRVGRLFAETSRLRAAGEIKGAEAKAEVCLAESVKAFGPDHVFIVKCVHSLARTRYDAGKYDDALKTFEEAVKLGRKALPVDHPQIALSVEGSGAALAAKAEWKEAEKRYREVLAFRRRVLGDDHQSTATAWNNLGQAMSLQAEHAQALEHYRNALKISKSIMGDHPETAKMESNVGSQLLLMGDPLGARTHYDDALRICLATVGRNHGDTATAENNLGFLHKSMGQLREARAHFDLALAYYTRFGGPKHPLRAAVLDNLGALAAQDGDYVTARRLYEEALAIRRDVFGPDHQETAATELSLAIILHQFGDPDATRLAERSMLALVSKLPADHPLLAEALDDIGSLLADDAEDEALVRRLQQRAIVRGILERSLKIRRERLGATHPYTLKSLNNLAAHYSATGEPEKAEEVLSDALAVCSRTLGDGHPLTSIIRTNLGGVCCDLNKHKEGEAHLKQAVAGFTKAYGGEHPNTAQSLGLLAWALAAQGKRADALAAGSAASAGYGTVARTLLAGTPESQHAAITAAWRPQVRVLLSIAATDPDRLEGHGPALFATVMDWKATSGRALLDRLEALTVGQVPEAGEKYYELRVRRRALVQGVMRGVGPEGVERYNADLEKSRARVETLERELAQQVKGYAAVARAREATPAEVAKKLPADGALIEFVLLDEIRSGLGALPKGVSAEASYLALVVTPKTGGEPDIKLVPLGPAKDVDQAIKNWRDMAKAGRRDRVVEVALRESVWDPLAIALPAGTKRLFVAPAGQLALVPFEAVWADDAYLVERYLISYLSTGRDLIPRPAPPGAPGPPVVVADPDFNHAGFQPGAPAPKGAAPAGAVSALAYASNPPPEDRLAGFAVEADAVAKLLGAKFPSAPKAFRRADATEENVQSIARPRVLYFITHGNFLRDQKALVAMEGRPSGPVPGGTSLLETAFGEDPRLRSYLALTGCNHWKERAARGLSDGLLTAREVGEMDLWGTDLVVTAACKTGEGHVHAGEGVLGLRRAFQQAGARTVVTSLWSVDDGGTAALLPRFLGHYLAGILKAEALRKAQLETIAELRAAEAKTKPKKKNQAAPFAWAAFICHGLPE